uniref:Uncharacterized protein n=1 Tax=Anguilla anguilla TaxID=7936 RepID=A0A0E9THK5_ANGAN
MPAEQAVDTRSSSLFSFLWKLQFSSAQRHTSSWQILFQGPVLLLWVIKLHTAVFPGVILIQSNCSWLKQTHIGYLNVS